jgi:hypothetical protein
MPSPEKNSHQGPSSDNEDLGGGGVGGWVLAAVGAATVCLAAGSVPFLMTGSTGVFVAFGEVKAGSN